MKAPLLACLLYTGHNLEEKRFFTARTIKGQGRNLYKITENSKQGGTVFEPNPLRTNKAKINYIIERRAASEQEAQALGL